MKTVLLFTLLAGCGMPTVPNASHTADFDGGIDHDAGRAPSGFGDFCNSSKDCSPTTTCTADKVPSRNLCTLECDPSTVGTAAQCWVGARCECFAKDSQLDLACYCTSDNI